VKLILKLMLHAWCIREIMSDPKSGIIKPEQLSYFEKELISGRMSKKYRLVYTT